MASADAQKSEVHDQTADASTSPSAIGDRQTTRSVSGHGQTSQPKPRDIAASEMQTTIISDQSDDGGPIVIESAEPSLNPPQVPQEKFPTDGIADVDVVSDVARPAKLRPTKR